MCICKSVSIIKNQSIKTFQSTQTSITLYKPSKKSKSAMEKGILGAKTIKQASRLMKANVFTCPELIEATYENIDN